ncbi:hypothetical protein FGIG_03960 [Fasciola gigantica]|uniref:Uncharacterized protein n=1 Tax=Fasciola gigantica TaxID=46835 RepID=A0A504Z8M0_FASGI|nr:hypothetical protein FGIG_03960 [Fasciola gigantica]
MHAVAGFTLAVGMHPTTYVISSLSDTMMEYTKPVSGNLADWQQETTFSCSNPFSSCTSFEKVNTLLEGLPIFAL